YLFGEPDTPEKDCEKLEFMGDGQQLVIDGIHPDTHAPYSWHGGKPGEDIKREDLPEIDNKDAADALAKDCVALIIEHFGYKLRDEPKAKKEKRANGEDTEPTDWSVDYIDHTSLNSHAMKLVRSGMNPGAVKNLLRNQVAALTNVDPECQKKRLKEISGMV